MFAKPEKIHQIALGLGWGDLLTLILSIIEVISITTLCCGMYFKYAGVYEKLYGRKKKKGKKDKKAKSRSKKRKR